MKSIKKISLLIMTAIALMLLIPGLKMQVKAAPGIIKQEYPIVLNGDIESRTYGIVDGDKNEFIHFKNYTPGIGTMKIHNKIGFSWVEFTFKKWGTAEIGDSVLRYRIKPVKYVNHAKSISIGKKKFSWISKYPAYTGKPISGKLVVTPKKGWTIYQIFKYRVNYMYVNGSFTFTNINNNSKIKLKDGEALTIILKNQKGKTSSYRYIAKK